MRNRNGRLSLLLALAFFAALVAAGFAGGQTEIPSGDEMIAEMNIG